MIKNIIKYFFKKENKLNMVEQQANRSSGNPFFKTVNQGYGDSWQASGGVHPL